MSADEAAARSGGPQRRAKDGVAAEGSRVGPSRAQVAVCQRGAVLLRADGGRQRRLCPAACVTRLSSKTQGKHSQSLLLLGKKRNKQKLHITEPMERASKFE